MSQLDIFIAGEPVTFATKAEKEWKDKLRKCIPNPKSSNKTMLEKGLEMHFYLQSFTHKGQPFDLDNLVEPVLAVLVNEKGFFGSRRSNIYWWYAIKRLSSEKVGVYIRTSQSTNPQITTSPCYNRIENLQNEDRFSVTLEFPMKTNIGDIATGEVKRVIDSLYEIIGGSAKAPNDWKIDELFIIKTDTTETKKYIKKLNR